MRRTEAEREQAILDEVAKLLQEMRGAARRLPRLVMNARLDHDLGLDSLARLELLSRLERRFRVEVPEQAGLEAVTPHDLLVALAGATPRGSGTETGTLQFARCERFELPTAAKTVVDVLAWHSEHHPDRLHIRFDGGDAHGSELTPRMLWASARRTAAGLQARRLLAGEAVAMMLPTHPDFMSAFFGVMLAGGVPVPLYPPVRPSEFGEYWRRQAGVLANCGARLLIGSAAIYARRRAVRTLGGGVEDVTTVARLQSAADGLERVSIVPADTALIQYTSGSTADPKGVVVTHAALLANLRIMGELIDARSNDVFVSWLPLYHDMGLIGAWLGSLYFGTPLVLMTPQGFLLRPERWLWAIHRYRATLSAAPNFAYELCVHRIADAELNGLDLSRWRIAFSGAEPVLPDTIERFCLRFSEYGFRRTALLPVYGLAENALGLTFPPVGREPRIVRVDSERFARGIAVPAASGDREVTAFVSCGMPLPAHEVRVVDGTGRELPEDREGHIEFRGVCATAGYFRNPLASAALVRDGWLDTGDLGFFRDGELFVTGRAKDLIIRAGRHLHPQGLEHAVGELPGVRRGRVVVFGTRSDAEGTERLVIVAETRLSEAAECDALSGRIRAVTETLAGGAPDDVVLVAPGTILKTSSGKLRRAAVRQAYDAGRLAPQRPWALAMLYARGTAVAVLRRLHRAGEWAFAAWAWLWFGLLVPLAFVAAMTIPGTHARWMAVRAVARALAAITLVPVEVRIPAKLPDTPTVFVSNHASYVDFLALLVALPRPVAFVAKADLQHKPWLRIPLRRLGVLFVARDAAVHATEIVTDVAGSDCVFFPEGTLTRTPGLRPFRLGAFSAAAAAAMPIVPVALRGTRSVLRDPGWFPRRGLITVILGAPLEPNASAERWPETLRLAAAARAFLLEWVGEPDLDVDRLGA